MRVCGVLARTTTPTTVGATSWERRSKASANCSRSWTCRARTPDESPWVTLVTGVDDDALVAHESGDHVAWARLT